MSISLFSKTPAVTVLDNRGLAVRDIAYRRHPDTPDITSEYTTHHQYNARQFLTQSADPRLHEAGQVNFTWLTDLTGNALRSQGVDNGTTVALNDAAGRQLTSLTEAVTRTWQYEDATLPGRMLSVTEQVTGEIARFSERFEYAGNSGAEKALNLAGVCVSHYDTAGLVQTDSIALTGVPLSVSRRLLKDADNPDVEADWQGEDASAWNDLLDGEAWTTLTTTDATGAVLTTTDAKGNRQRTAYDVAGLLAGSWLTLNGGTEQVIVKALIYSAAGQKLREEHGNGVVTTYTYEAETQRLTGISTQRPTGHASGAKLLQDLRYEYDPVGNVLSIRNDAEETRFWRNQKVVPENTYVYDSLYQLVSATGREMASIGQQSSNVPSAIVPVPSDSSTFTSYTRSYTYDAGGNLTQIRHSAPASGNSYTTEITVSDRSNRAVLSTLTQNPSDVDALFTPGGQQKQLQPGQTLTWTPRNELLKVTPVVRDGGVDDRESYRYDGGSQRILKVSMQKTGGSTQTQRALYLPGLELRTTGTESLQVITVGEAGRAQVRILHWESGIPADMSNDPIRYSYDNLIGRSQLELDRDGNIISMEEFYPYGGTAVWAARSQTEAGYKTIRYSGKERDATGLYYYGYRYYQPWAGRWLSADPAETVDGLNLFRMVRNNPVTLYDSDGLAPELSPAGDEIKAAGEKEIKKRYPDFYKKLKAAGREADRLVSRSVRQMKDDYYSERPSAELLTDDFISQLETLVPVVKSYAKDGADFSQHVVVNTHLNAQAYVSMKYGQVGTVSEAEVIDKRVFWSEKSLNVSTDKITHAYTHELSHLYMGTGDFFYNHDFEDISLDEKINNRDFWFSDKFHDSPVIITNKLSPPRKVITNQKLYDVGIGGYDLEVTTPETFFAKKENRLRALRKNADTVAAFVLSYDRRA